MEDQNQRNNQGNPRARRLFALAGPIDHQSFDEELDALLDATHFTLEQEKAFNTADDNFRALQQQPLTDEEQAFNALRNNLTTIMTKPSSEAAQIRAAVKKYQEEHPNTLNSQRLEEIGKNIVTQIHHAKALKKVTPPNN